MNEPRREAREHVDGLPADTLAPVSLAAGVTLIAAGVVTSPIASAAGAVIAVVALYRWIATLWEEPPHVDG